jgi:hypothetical protein
MIERIKPGHPQQNGRHERMHLTLKKEAMPLLLATKGPWGIAFLWFGMAYGPLLMNRSL